MIDSAIEQIYTNCLAQGSYFIESNGEAVVIDPLREPGPYIKRAEERGVVIKYIFETHFHADFVSGHLDLAKKTGATIVYGPGANTEFEVHNAEDGEEFSFGKLKIKVLHTPGHTAESSTFLLFDESGREHAIFSGDTLFIGDVGRPDLAQKATGLTQEDLAGWLFDSLRMKIMSLPDEVIVYPGHGAGSACGKNMSDETWDTLGNQKRTNYALRESMTKEEFIKEVTDGLMAPPQYFAMNVAMNKNGYNSVDEAMERGMNALSVEEFKQILTDDSVLVLDVRARWDFVEGFIPGSIFIGLDGSFAPWVGALIPNLKQKIALVCPSGREEETVRRLARVGYDFAIGYLKGGYEAWQSAGQKTAKINTVKVEDFIGEFDPEAGRSVLDVRNSNEYETAHLNSAENIPLDNFSKENYKELDPNGVYYLHCRSGYRSTVATSILKANGFRDLINIIGSFDTIKTSGLDVLGTCPSLS